MVVQGDFRLLLGVLAGAVAGIGDTVFRQGVGAQEFGNAVTAGVARGLHHAFEHGRRRVRVEAGVHQGLHADPVRLLLVGATVAQHAALGGRLGRRHGRHAGIGAGGGHQDETGQHGRQRQRLVFLLEFHPAGKMALAEVGDLVGQHGHQLIFGLGIQQQAVVDANHATGHGESVDLRAVHDHHFHPPVLQLAVGDQQVNEVFQVVVQQGVVHRAYLAAEHLQPGAPQLVLEFSREHAGAGFAQVGKLEFLGARRQADGEQHRQQYRQHRLAGRTVIYPKIRHRRTSPQNYPSLATVLYARGV